MNFFNRLQRVALIPLGLLAIANTLSAGTIIDTTTSWDHSTYAIVRFNDGLGDDTVGETIIAPSTDNVLNSFSFFVEPYTSVGSFSAIVTAFGLGGGGSIPIGPILYQSSLVTVTGTQFQQVVFNTGGVSLTPGSQYALLLTTTGLAGSVAGVKFGFVACCTDPYALGRTVSDDNSQHASVPFYSAYGNTNSDVAFTASFDSVATESGTPEPATGFLLFAGIIACAGLKLRTRVPRKSRVRPC